jgi:hypothetical protein
MNAISIFIVISRRLAVLDEKEQRHMIKTRAPRAHSRAGRYFEARTSLFGLTIMALCWRFQKKSGLLAAV